MNATGRQAALARLQFRRQQLERELARVERQIVRAERQLVAVEQRIAGLLRSRRPAA